MTSQVEKMEREILILYPRVIHQGRSNVAEHLLCCARNASCCKQSAD